jgi:hypothetical protein
MLLGTVMMRTQNLPNSPNTNDETMITATLLARRYLLCAAPRVNSIAAATVGSIRASTAVAANTSSSTTTAEYAAASALLEVKPDIIFDEIDIDQSGVISKEQFVEALNRLNYYELKRVHKVVHANMEHKLKAVDTIEEGLRELAEAHAEKSRAYSNVGMMTACEIDALFDKTRKKKQAIKESVPGVPYYYYKRYHIIIMRVIGIRD